MCVSQAGRDRKGRARRSHRVRTDVVLTALKGKMPTKGLGGGCPLGHTAVTNNKNSNNTHHHQSGHRHSALDLEEPLVGGRGMMRYLCRPTGQHDGGNSGTGLKTQRGEKGGGELIKWPDCASTRLCFVTTEQSGGDPQSQGVGRGGCSCRKAASLWVGISALG